MMPEPPVVGGEAGAEDLAVGDLAKREAWRDAASRGLRRRLLLRWRLPRGARRGGDRLHVASGLRGARSLGRLGAPAKAWGGCGRIAIVRGALGHMCREVGGRRKRLRTAARSPRAHGDAPNAALPKLELLFFCYDG